MIYYKLEKMSLKITKNEGVYYLNGNINSKTSKSLGTHLEFLIRMDKRVIVNLDNISEIDIKALLLLKKLHTSFLKYDGCFQIRGWKSKEIYERFKSVNIA